MHKSEVVQQFLRQNALDFIVDAEWISYSPDINPLGYCIWNILQDLVYEGGPERRNQNKNLAIANRSRVSCAHNTLRASIGLNITP